MLAGLQTSYKPAAAGSRYWSSQDRDANLQLAAAEQHLTPTWFVFARGGSVIGQWGRKRGAWIAREAHNLPWETHEKVALWADCSSAKQASRTGFGLTVIGSLGPLQPVVGAARMKRGGRPVTGAEQSRAGRPFGE